MPVLLAKFHPVPCLGALAVVVGGGFKALKRPQITGKIHPNYGYL